MIFTRLAKEPTAGSSPDGMKYVTTQHGHYGHYGVILVRHKPIYGEDSCFWAFHGTTTEPGEFYHELKDAQEQAYWYAAEHALPFHLPGFDEPPDPLEDLAAGKGAKWK